MPSDAILYHWVDHALEHNHITKVTLFRGESKVPYSKSCPTRRGPVRTLVVLISNQNAATETKYYSGILTIMISHLPWRRPHGRAWVPSPQLLHTVDSPRIIYMGLLLFERCSSLLYAHTLRKHPSLPCWNQREISNGLSPLGGSRHHTTSSLLIAMKATKSVLLQSNKKHLMMGISS